MAELVFLRRGEEVLRFTLDKPRVVLGRGERCDVAVPDPEVSRQQAALVTTAAGVEIEDLSGKGLVVAGKRVSHATLVDGADIALGQWRAVFRERTSSTDDDAATEIGQQTELAQRSSDGPRITAQLRVRGASRESVHKLTVDTFTVGKDSSNDLVINERYVSSRHLKVVRSDNRFHLYDQQSTNGTWLGPVRVYEAELPLFSTVKLGDTELVFEPTSTAALAAGAKGGTSYEGLVGTDGSMRALAELIERVAPSTAAVAIFGESGTGKELVARAVHNRSTRAEKAFIPVNCAAISKELIESELFGHEKGAFTGAEKTHRGAFEEADGGTLFLDEIGELPLELQAKLLRALESGEIKRVGAARPTTVDVRIVAATNRDLLEESRKGRFREDLYYRLCVVPLNLPPLRSRKADVPMLAAHFMRLFSPRGQPVALSQDAVAKLASHSWPGNVRELRNVLHRALLLRRGHLVEAGDIVFPASSSQSLPLPDGKPPLAPPVSGQLYVPGRTLEEHLQALEKEIVLQALKHHGNSKEKVGRELGVGRSTIFKRLKDWGLTGGEGEGE
ncbi:MAG: sigma 54-dependent Fis family transcriptional regulator [Myxococcaceae bacterium]|nr:sigma 54-dependent Fis family transcriptional regulator [Myxococcaceae bacterium]